MLALWNYIWYDCLLEGYSLVKWA